MDLEITLLLVTAGKEPTELVDQLEARGLFVETTSVSELPQMLPVVVPDLVVQVGSEGADQVAEHLGTLSPQERVRLAIVAERPALPSLRQLDREIVVTLLSDDVPREALTTRLATIGRRLAQQAQKLRSSAPPAGRARPRPVPPPKPAPAVGAGQPAPVEAFSGTQTQGSGLLRLGPAAAQEKTSGSRSRVPPSPLPEPPADIPVSDKLEVVRGETSGPIRSIVVADDDVMRGDQVAQALRSRGLDVQLVPLDPAATKWPVLKQFEPDALLADGTKLRGSGVVWLQLFRADSVLARATLLTLPFEHLFDDRSGELSLLPLEDELGPPPTAEEGLEDEEEEGLEDDDRPTLIAPNTELGMEDDEDDRPTIAQEGFASPFGKSPFEAEPEHSFSEEPKVVPSEEPSVVAPEEPKVVPPEEPSVVAPEEPKVVPPEEPKVVVQQPTAPVLDGNERSSPAAVSVETKKTSSKVPKLLGAALAMGTTAAVGGFVWPGWLTGPAHDGETAAAPTPQKEEPPPRAEPSEPKKEEPPSLWVVPPRDELAECSEVTDAPDEITRGTIQKGSVAWERARKSLVQGDLKKAHRQLCEAALNHPKSLALEGLAELYLRFHQPKEAERWLTQALEHRPDRRKTLELIADVHSQLGNPDAAQASLAQALKVAPDDQKTMDLVAKRHVTDATAALASGDLTGAEKHGRRAASLSPTSADAAAVLARVMLASDRSQLARRWVERALELDEASADAHVAAGDLARAEGNTEQARTHYERAVEIEPGHSSAWRKKSTLGE